MISELIASSLLLLCTLSTINNVEAAGRLLGNETDRQALIAIKAEIPDDPFGVLTSWNSSVHFCIWEGVTCGRLHQRVTALRLGSIKIGGRLSPHLGNLTFLKVVDLRNNSFHGSIPQEVGRLYRLQKLYLQNNFFQGEFPRNLTQCLDLARLVLAGNKLGGEIPSELGFLPKLYGIALESNNFTGTIPPSFGNLSSIGVLSLMENNLEGSIPPQLGQLSELWFLQLSSNRLSGLVPQQLFNASSISFFSVADNYLDGQIPPDLGLTLPNIEHIYLGGNLFTGPIPMSMTNASGLIAIDMSSNGLTGTVPKNLGTLEHLQQVNFADNPLGDKNANDLSFLTSLTNCTNLTFLSFYQNQLRGVLPDSIANLSNKLSRFRLDKNYISGSIPLGIGNLIGLEFLSLNENMLTGEIPDSIGKLSKLQLFHVFTNRISGKIPFSIGNITALMSLLLGNNLLEGSIPVSLGNCMYLKELDLSQNHLNGVIPKQVIGLSSFLAVGLASNNLTGTLPTEVSSSKDINVLDISENQLSGEIPTTLEDCVMLEMLIMGGNNFGGTIPSSLRRLRSMQFLDLSRNNLSGQIPEFISGLPLLLNLNLSFNSFEGEVPALGVFQNRSAFSVLGNKELCGGIKSLQLPKCPTKGSKKKKLFSRKLVIIATTTSVFLFIVLFIACLFAYKYHVRTSKRRTSFALPFEKKYPKQSYADLLTATDGFSPVNLIGQGRYGSVYKGTLSDGERTVAVKVLNLQQREANKTFLAECKALRSIRHRNLVKIITSCSSIDFQGNDFKALVFEFMPNGNLASWLNPNSTEPQHSRDLNLIQRLNIAIDVASALHYLHNLCDTPVVHCDLKPSNILLDNDLTAHVSDFGLTRFLSSTTDDFIHAESSLRGIRGTVGYIAPEYGMGEEVSTVGDVYSYGILLMELFTGRSPTGSMFPEHFSLRDFVKMALPDRVLEIVDPQLNFEEQGELYQTRQSNRDDSKKIKECLASIFQIAVICSAALPRERMDIEDVLAELQKIRNMLLGDHRSRRQ